METPQPDRHYSRVSSLLTANGMIDAGMLILSLGRQSGRVPTTASWMRAAHVVDVITPG